jgi:ribonuclease J
LLFLLNGISRFLRKSINARIRSHEIGVEETAMVKVIPLGGLGEIGLNMMVIEHDQCIVVVDAGLMFPDDYMPGVDLVIPDFRYLRDNKDRISAVLLTHGHEDHIGAMPYFLREFSVPVFGTDFTLALLKERLREHQLLERAQLQIIGPGVVSPIGPFTVEYIRVKHSIVDGVGLAIDTPEGTLIHSGDFKIDPSSGDGESTDLIRFAHFGNRGVVALLSDSTNAEKEGFTISERDVQHTLEEIFRHSQGRIIVSTFASNISRIQQIVHTAVKFGRKISFSGKSMLANVAIAREHGFLSIPDKAEVGERSINHYADEEVTIITTGSQGEPMSVLARISQGRHKSIHIKEGDTIILSSRFIPGNERAITKIINSFYRMGAEVIYEKVSDIHTSGHARREELKLLLNLVNPQYFIPIHGEYRQLVKHAQVARDVGIPKERILLAQDGDIITLDQQQVRLEGSVQAGRILVDGKGVGDVGELVLRDRRRLSGHGMVIVLMALDEASGETVYGPDIISRGFVFEDQEGHLLEEAKCIVLEVLDDLDHPLPVDMTQVGADIERRLKRFFYQVIERSPLVLPIIISI